MYVAVVALTMLVLPLVSVLIAHAVAPSEALVTLVGRWFVFWAVGVRLGLAGVRQILQPRFTAQDIFHIEGDGALPLVRELGVANAGTALVGLLSLPFHSFALPAAISASLFYAVAGLTHLGERDRSLNENVAMISDLWAALVLAGVVLSAIVIR